MSTIISEHDLGRLAALARLQLDSVESHALTEQLESILEYVRLLQKVDTGSVKAFSDQYAHKAHLRSDEVQSWPGEGLLTAVPTENNLLIVKNVFNRHES